LTETKPGSKNIDDFYFPIATLLVNTFTILLEITLIPVIGFNHAGRAVITVVFEHKFLVCS